MNGIIVGLSLVGIVVLLFLSQYIKVYLALRSQRFQSPQITMAALSELPELHRPIFEEAQQTLTNPPFHGKPFAERISIVKSLIQQLTTPRASLKISVLGMAVYFLLLLAPVGFAAYIYSGAGIGFLLGMLTRTGQPDWGQQLSEAESKEAYWEILLQAGQWYAYAGQDEAAAEKYLQEALERAGQFEDKEIRIVRCLRMLAAIARKVEQARAYYHQALVVLEAAEDIEKIHTADILEELAWLERDEGNLDIAIEYLEQTVEMWQQDDQDDLLSSAWHVFETLADFYEDTESTFLTVLAMYHSEPKTSQESLPLGDLLERITQFYLRQNEVEKARTFLQEQCSLLQQNPDRVEHYTLSRLATLLGWIYILQEDTAADLFSQALEHYEQSVIARASERMRQDIAKVPILLDLVYVALKQGKRELADIRFAEVKTILNKAEMFTRYVEHLQEEMRELQEVDFSKDWELQRRHAHADLLRQYAE